ncbi:Mycothiol acetyltransferase [Streptomyces hundungensis]|uniref:Mycothiol acetyltransferase n=1 Tax=Streptomyces hundungensis TaxID=1077946 RepID=A0A387HI02_9ACTN|nr:GNAT family N-acetyltransferase [Streptomyces hundungensis]AYG80358.1 Mycothiol acetyltransferase [Streptomyces hundungensis]
MVRISPATEHDLEAIADILGETEAYYGGENDRPPLDQIRSALFGESPAAVCLLAHDGDQVLGLASYSLLWPAAGADSSLYLKELYVREGARRRGVARALMDAVKSAAVKAGCSRVEWTADTDNPPALALYEALGVPQHQGKVFYRVSL